METIFLDNNVRKGALQIVLKKKNEKSLYFVKVRSVLRGISVKLLFKCVFGGLYGGFVMGAAKE